MPRIHWATSVAVVVLAVCASAVLGDGSRPFKRPVIVLTDIGTDVDDTWALGVLLQSRAYEVTLVVAESHNTPARARVAAKLLTGAGKGHIPIALGIQQDSTDSYLYGWASDFDLATYSGGVAQDGVSALIAAVKSPRVPPILLVLSPCPTLLAAFEREPSVFVGVHVFAMMGSVRRGYKGASHPDAEYNVYDDLAAAKALFDRSRDGDYRLTITPLDTCGVFQISGEPYERFLRAANGSSPIATLILESYKYWEPRVPWCTPEAPLPCDPSLRSSVLYDVVAVGMMGAFASRSELVFEELPIDVVGNMTVVAPAGKPADVAMAWASERDAGHHSRSIMAFGSEMIDCIVDGC